MSWLDGLRHRLGVFLHPGAYAEELDEEFRHHQELASRNEGDADLARRQFGNSPWYKEEARLMTWLRFTDVLGQDLRSAWRGIARSPALALLIIGTLALGFGANAATFSILDALYLRPPAGVADPGSVRGYWVKHFLNLSGREPFTSQALNYPMYRAIVEARGPGASVALYVTDDDLHLGRGLTGPRVRAIYATASYFNVLGVEPILGRRYSAVEDSLGSPTRVALISHAFWQGRLGGDPAVLGKPLVLGPTTYTVVGVLAPEFTGLDLQPADIWLPLSTLPPPSWIRGPWWEADNPYYFHAIERLNPGVSERGVEARVTAALRELNRIRFPSSPDTLMQTFVGSAIRSRGPGTPASEQLIATRVAGVAIVVLLIAWANVINLLLAQAVSRRREIAVRLALGISRARLVRMLILETLMLAGFAAAAATLVAWGGGTALRALLLPDVEWNYSVVDWRVATFTALVALGSALVAGLTPALQASRPVLTDALKEGAKGSGRRHSRLRNALVMAQAGLAVTLLVGAGLFLRSLRNVEGLDIGYDAGQLLFGDVEFEEGSAPAPEALGALAGEVEARLRGQPGIEAVARSNIAPMWGFGMMNFYSGADSAGSFRSQEPTVLQVTPGFFRAVGIRIEEGEDFAASTGGAPPAAVVVNDAMARLLWPGQRALGQCIRVQKRDNPCLPVVGVVETVRQTSVIEDPKPQFYLPLGSTAARAGGGTIIVRASPNGTAAAGAELLAELRRAFPGALAKVTPMTRNLEREYRPFRLGATLFTALGLLALLVAAFGVYSTIAYDVRQRTHEFGVRMALGARMLDLVGQVVGEGVGTVAKGVLLGVGLSLAGGKLIASLLYGIAPHDPAVLLLVAAILLAAAALAAALPARRAARTDPMTAIRTD